MFPDQHRGDWLPYPKQISQEQFGMEPLTLRMPNVASLMQRGTTFTRAITPSPLCAPARACIASGLTYEHCPVKSNGTDYPLDLPTFYSALKDSGYEVGGVGKFDLHKKTHWWGLDGWIEDLGLLGFTVAVDNAGKIDAINSGKDEPKDPYMKYLHDRDLVQTHLQDMKGRGKKTNPTDLPEEAYCDNWLSANGIEMIKNFPKNKPWFLVVNFTGPHSPYDVTKRMWDAWQGVDFPLPVEPVEDREHCVALRQNYAAMLENIDRNIGLMLQEVQKRGELDNTIIIYASDHGEMLGDFGRYGKTRPERGSVHIPLIFAGPGVKAGVISDALVELQDLTRTIVELADAQMPEATDSLSLLPLLTGDSRTHRDVQISAIDDWKMVSDGQYKLIIQEGKAPRLYHLPSDPWELQNIAETHKDRIRSWQDRYLS
jgi:arylsulfatase A-like enzyme